MKSQFVPGVRMQPRAIEAGGKLPPRLSLSGLMPRAKAPRTVRRVQILRFPGSADPFGKASEPGKTKKGEGTGPFPFCRVDRHGTRIRFRDRGPRSSV